MNLETIDLTGANYLAILAGGAAYFALGALWYTVLFGNRWIAATGRTREEFERMRERQPDSSPAWMLATSQARSSAPL